MNMEPMEIRHCFVIVVQQNHWRKKKTNEPGLDKNNGTLNFIFCCTTFEAITAIKQFLALRLLHLLHLSLNRPFFRRHVSAPSTIGVRSGLGVGHLRVNQCFALRHSWVFSAVCFGSSSCWRAHYQPPRPSFQTEGYQLFCLFVCLLK